VQVEERKPTMKGPDQWFAGDAFLDLIAQSQGPTPVSLGSVHFTPCAHTAWHRHSLGQTLYVTEGEGFVQARGGPLIRIRPGDVIVTPPNEWHWHGATPTTFMTHLAFTEGDTEWGEHLTDEEYPT
jgi:quercetin dioxygenase-like cupin family protein